MTSPMTAGEIGEGLSADERAMLISFEMTNIVPTYSTTPFDLQRKGLVSIYTGGLGIHGRIELTDLGRAVALELQKRG